MKEFLPILIVLACPLMMMFMMRGMHGGANNQTGYMGHQMGHGHMASPTRADDDERIAELEQEVAQLKADRDFHRWEAGT